VASGSSAAWLARLPWEQEVGSSNLLSPTIFLLLALKLRRKLLAYSFTHPDETYYVRELSHPINEDPGNLSKETGGGSKILNSLNGGGRG
jgi:hypothetical protein